MITVPNRLYGESFVDVIHQSKHFAILSKRIDQPVLNRQSYVSLHAVSFVIAGTQKIVENEQDFIRIQAGEIGFVKKGIYTVTDLLSDNEGFQSFHLYFDDTILEEVLQLFPRKPSNESLSSNVCFKISSNTSILQYFTSLKQMHYSLQYRTTQLFKIKLLEFLTLVISESSNSRVLEHLTQFTTQHKNRNLRTFMGENFDKPLTLADYAYLTGRSLSTFRREFKTKYGVSPRKWITQKRMEKAKELLEVGEESVAGVAYNVGYENVSHFISGFKKCYGFHPKASDDLQSYAKFLVFIFLEFVSFGWHKAQIFLTYL